MNTASVHMPAIINDRHACGQSLTEWLTHCHKQKFIFFALIYMQSITELCGNMQITNPSSFLLSLCVTVVGTLAV